MTVGFESDPPQEIVACPNAIVGSGLDVHQASECAEHDGIIVPSRRVRIRNADGSSARDSVSMPSTSLTSRSPDHGRNC